MLFIPCCVASVASVVSGQVGGEKLEGEWTLAEWRFIKKGYYWCDRIERN